MQRYEELDRRGASWPATTPLDARRKCLFLSTAAIALACPCVAAAQTTISTATTAPLRTSTAGSITVTSAGSVTPASGTAATIDSANSVSNDGAIQVTDASNAIGVEALANTGGGIANTGKITVDENYTATDTDSDGDIDGPFALGSGRFGIRTDGAFTGNVSNAAAGVITIEGNDSAGIRLAGPLAGSFSNLGTITVTGDRSAGIDLAAIAGDATLSGTVSALGAGAVGARLSGAVSGTVTVQGTITATGYRYVTLPSSTTNLDADDLLQGGSAVVIAGDVAGGVTFASDSSTSPSIHTYGQAPAVAIGAAGQGVTIGAISGRTDGFGLVVNGSVLGSGVYAGISGTGFAIGGLGGAVAIAGGMQIGGTVQGTSNAGNATGALIGAGATVPRITVSGALYAAGGGTSGNISTALLIDNGASVTSIGNTGAIGGTASSVDGTAIGIQDRAGTVSLVENSGSIYGQGATAGTGRNIAMDLSASTGGVTVRQSGSTSAVISGDILLSAGADTLDIQTGRVSGIARFGAGSDTMTLSGSSTFSGGLDFGAGAKTLAISGTAAFTGTVTNGGALAVTLTGGTFRVSAPTTIGALSVDASGTLGVALDSTTTSAAALTVNGAASFASGATVSPQVTSVIGAEGRHIALSAGSLAQAGALTLNSSALPYLYTASLATSGNQIIVNVARRTATELALGRAAATIYDPAYRALAGDTQIAGVYLNQTTAAGVQAVLAQSLPDQADATFEMATLGTRALARVIDDPQGYIREGGKLGYWLAPVGWNSKRRAGDTSGYSLSGYGVAGGAEVRSRLGNFGAMAAYMSGKDETPGTYNTVESRQYQGGGYWRGVFGAFESKAQATYSHLNFDGSRQFVGTSSTESVDRTAQSSWGGNLVSSSAQASFEMGNDTFFFRPLVTAEYNRLREGAHAETDAGGTGFALAVAGRTSDETALTASVAGGFDVFGVSRDWLGRKLGEHWFRLEAEAGRREVVAGTLGATVAQFSGGDAFSLDAARRASGWVGRLRVAGGGDLIRLAGEVGGEERDGRIAVTARANLRISVF